MILVLCTQMLPLEAIGRVLYQNQLIEEIQGAHDAPAKSVSFAELDKYIPHFFYHGHHLFFTVTSNKFFEFSDRLTAQFIKDVQTPPPNKA